MQKGGAQAHGEAGATVFLGVGTTVLQAGDIEIAPHIRLDLAPAGDRPVEGGISATGKRQGVPRSDPGIGVGNIRAIIFSLASVDSELGGGPVLASAQSKAQASAEAAATAGSSDHLCNLRL